ncbi:MAG: TrkA C-terminal domain-containing protein [Flavobacteriaceae bacterium]|nr:TrkA C-terminal domain-containing protein [Flavobacteriaceae bacterium]
MNREVPLVSKKCRVTNPEFFGKTLHQTIKEIGHEIVISRLKHSKTEGVFSPTLDTHLLEKDVLMVVGLEEDVNDFINRVGRESSDLIIESASDIQVKNIFVTNPKATHKKLNELDLYNKYELKVTRVFRAGREILARPSLELFYGDKLRIVGTKEAIDEIEKGYRKLRKKTVGTRFSLHLWWFVGRNNTWLHPFFNSFSSCSPQARFCSRAADCCIADQPLWRYWCDSFLY